jgi:hypothetical protein
MKSIERRILLVCALLLTASLRAQAGDDKAGWTPNGAPAETYITGGGWTLEQSGAAVGLKSAGYCDSHGNQIGNPGTERITYLRLAQTTDGIHFTDLGPLQGLNDITDVTATGTRWLATAGTILKLEGGRYGLLFSGGGCIDGDSDAFHYIGYAESSDLIHWAVVNGINNPIVSSAPFTIAVDSNGVPATSGGTLITVPANTPVVGNTMGWFAGRVYAPSATLFDRHDVTVIFAGYHTPKPKNGLGDYRTIGRVSLHSSQPLRAVGAGDGGGDEGGH